MSTPHCSHQDDEQDLDVNSTSLSLSEQDSPTGNTEAKRTEFADWTYRGVLHEVIANSSVFPVLSKVGAPIDNIIASFMR